MDEWLRKLFGDPEKDLDPRKRDLTRGAFPVPDVYQLPDLNVTAPKPSGGLADVLTAGVRRAQIADKEAETNPEARRLRDEALREAVGRSQAAEGAFKDAAASPLLFALGGAATAGNLAESTGKLTGIDPLERVGRGLRENASQSRDIVGSTALANVPYAGGALAANMVPYMGAAKIAPWAAKGAGAALAGRAVASAPVDAVQAVQEEGNLAGLLGEGARAVGLDTAGDVLDTAGETFLGRFATEVLANAIPDAAIEFALPGAKKFAQAASDQNTRIMGDRTGAINLGGADDGRLGEIEARLSQVGAELRALPNAEKRGSPLMAEWNALHSEARVIRDGAASAATDTRKAKAAETSVFPEAGPEIDGLRVGDRVDNTESIRASIESPEVAPSIRAVPLEATADPLAGMNPADRARIESLAEEINANGRIDPLIVVEEPGGGYYILEGSHRLPALQLLGKKEFPALVVRDGSLDYSGVRPSGEPRTINQLNEPKAVEGLIPEGPALPNTKEFINVPKFDLQDLDGEVRLVQAMSRVVETKGLDPKRVVTWDETRKMAEEIGLSVLDIDKSKAARMTGAEALAINNVVSANVSQQQQIAQQLADATIPATEREMLERTFKALDSQNMNLLEKFTIARSQSGRNLNIYKMHGNRTNDPVFWMAKAQSILGPERYKQLGDGFRADVVRLAGEGKMDELYKLLDTARRTPLADTIGSLFQAGLLYTPKTHIVNFTGNIVMGALENVKDAPAAMFDHLISLATQQRTVSAPTIRQVQASMQGAKQGVKEAALILKGVPVQEALQRFDMPMELRSGSVVLDTYAAVPFRLLSAGDRVFRGAALQSSLANQAETLAKAEGLKGADLAARATQLRGAPSDEMVLRAIADAEEAVFQDRTWVGDLLKRMQDFKVDGFPAGKFIMPFSRTPGAISTRAAEYSPLGLAVGLRQASGAITKALRGGNVPAEVQRNVSRLLGRGTVGTGVVATGFYLASEGMLTPQGDQADRTGRDTRGLTGQPEGALKLGDTFIDVGRFAPTSNLLLLGAALHEAAKDAGGLGASGAAGTMGGSLLRGMSDQPFFTGLDRVKQAVENPNAGTNYLTQTAASAVPFSSILGAAARGTDDVIREPEGLGQTIAARIPGLSKSVPAALDQFGQPALRRDPGVVNQMLNPAATFPDRAAGDPVREAIVSSDAGISRRRPGRGETKEDVRKRVEFEGPRIERALEQLIRSAKFTRATPETQQDLIQSKVQSERAAATADYKRRRSGLRN